MFLQLSIAVGLWCLKIQCFDKFLRAMPADVRNGCAIPLDYPTRSARLSLALLRAKLSESQRLSAHRAA